MWPFITCGRSLSVMISLHSKPDLEKGNTTFTLVLRKFLNIYTNIYSFAKYCANMDKIYIIVKLFIFLST